MRYLVFFVVFAFIVISCKQKSSTEQIDLSFPIDSLEKDLVIPVCPEWVHNAIFYQVYPQTFYDSDADGIGDLSGIISKLDYIKSLGVNAIWLNPFYVSPFRDAGYDVSDYYQVAPRYGTNDDARLLFEEAKKIGLKVIVDFVPGHTSIDHPWFQQSAKCEKNKYSNWYIWTNKTWFKGMEKYNEKFIQGYSDRDGNYMINFFYHQPALNFGWGEPDSTQSWQLPVNHPDIMALRNEMKEIIRYWLKMGADGMRVDMAGSLVKNDNEQKIKEFWLDVRKMIDEEYPQAFFVSEWSHPTNAMNTGFHADFMHWFGGYDDLCQKEIERNQFSTGNSFFDGAGKGNITHFLDVFLSQYKSTRGKGYVCVPIGNHDLIRINNNGRDTKDLLIIKAFELTMPHVPFIYYGDEIGMRQLDNIQAKEGAYGTRAGARTPMQWNGNKNKGFSEASPEKLYLPVDSTLNAPNVEEQLLDSGSLMNEIKKLILLRRTEKALSAYANFLPLYAKENQYPFVYLRSDLQSKLLIVLNPSASQSHIEIDLLIQPDSYKLIAGDLIQIVPSGSKSKLLISGKSYSIIKLNNN